MKTVLAALNLVSLLATDLVYVILLLQSVQKESVAYANYLTATRQPFILVRPGLLLNMAQHCNCRYLFQRI
jgi:hypothetical protein